MGVGKLAPQSPVLSSPPSPASSCGQLLPVRQARSLVSSWSSGTLVKVSVQRRAAVLEQAPFTNVLTLLLT